jgi:hypothetical protein
MEKNKNLCLERDPDLAKSLDQGTYRVSLQEKIKIFKQNIELR